MSKKKKSEVSEKLAKVVVHGMQEKKGNDIVMMDMQDVNATISDYFVICHADSPSQVSAIAKSVEEEVYKALDQEPWKKEGHENGEWILLDFVDVVVHIFRTEKRHFYGIEELWGDAEAISFQTA